MILLKRLLVGLLAVGAGLLLGMGAIMFLHQLFGIIFPDSATTPELFDDPVALAKFIEEMSISGLLGVVIAHQVGTLFGAIIAVLLTKRVWTGWTLGAGFLVMGILNIMMIPHPLWLAILDLELYLPMGWLAIRIVLGSAAARFV